MAKLVAKSGFNAFGVQFSPGDDIPNRIVSEWPEGTLQRRLEGGDVGYVSDSGDALPPSDELAQSLQAATAERDDLRQQLEAVKQVLTKKQREQLGITGEGAEE